MSKSTKIKPIIKWAGGKSKIVHLIEDRIKELNFHDKVMHEPFAGGISVSINLSRYFRKIIISDVNNELINTYLQVKNNVEGLINLLEKFSVEDSEEFYYRIRSSRNHEHTFDYEFISARFIYLNKTCFNGLYRINKKGQFNVPYGRYKNPNIVKKDNFISLSKLLNDKFEIINMDFTRVIDNVAEGDFVYLDPPYDPVTENSFHNYQSGGFPRYKQIELKLMMDKLTSKGVYVIMSNSVTEFTLETYKEYINSESIIEVRRLIGSKSNSRKQTTELLIDNFDRVREMEKKNE